MHNERFSLNLAMQSTNDLPTDFWLYSDRFQVVFPGYVLDEQCKVRPGPNTPTVNFANLKELLRSKDVSRNEELDWVNGDSLRFLDQQDMTG